MAGTTVVRQILVEMRATNARFDADMTRLEQRVQQAGQRVNASGAGVEGLGRKYATSARQIASATETIASSSGTATGAVKTLVAQVGNLAFAFGSGGQLVAAASIGALAVGSALSRIKEEVAATLEEIGAETQRQFDALNTLAEEQDSKAVQRAINRLDRGEFMTRNVGDVWRDPAELERLGLERLQAAQRGLERRIAADQAVVDAARRRGVGFGHEGGGAATRPESAAFERLTGRRNSIINTKTAEGSLVEQLDAVNNAVSELNKRREFAVNQLTKTTEAEEANAAALKRTKDALEATTRAQEELTRDLASFGQNFERMALRELGDAGNQIAAEFDALLDEAERLRQTGDPRAPTDAQVIELERMRAAAIEATDAIAATEDALADLDRMRLDGIEPTVDTFRSLGDEGARLTRILAGLERGTARYKAVQKQLDELNKKQADELADIADANKGGAKAVVKDTATIARQLHQATDGALQLAQAMGLVSENATGVLRSVSQIAGNLPALGKALATGGSFGIAAAALPILGAVASLFGRSPADEKRQAELRANTRALEELTEKAGLLGLNVTGTEAVGARAGAAAIAAAADRRRAELIEQFGPMEGNRLSSGLNAKTIARSLGISFKDLQEIAKKYGVSLNKEITSVEQFIAALDEANGKLGEFGTDLASQQRQAEAEIIIDGITDPLERLLVRTGATSGRSPALDAVTGGLDLSTPEGRAEARKRAQALFDTMKAGGTALTEGQMGGLNGDELLQAILDLVQSLNDLDADVLQSTNTVADQVIVAERTQITADQASRLLGLETSQLRVLELIARTLAASKMSLPVPAADVFSTAPASGSGAPVFHITVHNEFLGGVTGEQAGLVITDGMMREIERRLGRNVTVARLHSGDPVIR